MSSERVHEFDTIIIGGGIAALWTANELKSAGQKIALLCNGPLGDGQTLAAQGVIHGGLKYALGGKLTDASEELAAMPQRWSDALAGKGPVDLSTTAVLSDHQILWTLPKLVSRVAGFFGSKSVRGRSAAIPREEFPEVFARGEYRGSLFRIEEPVVDPVSLVEALAAGVESCSWQVEWGTSAELVAINGSVDSIRLPSEGANVRLRADRYLLLAGSGNEALLQQIGIESPRMQRRPLHQLIIRSQHLPDFYSVCVGTGPKPPLVSTTHTDRAGRRIWYIGGDIAEQAGVARSEADQITAGKTLFAELLPWIDLSEAEWFTWRGDRAEPLTGTGDRPPGAYCTRVGNCLIGWPTKLALAPDLARQVLGETEAKLGPEESELPLPRPTLGRPPWDLP